MTTVPLRSTTAGVELRGMQQVVNILATKLDAFFSGDKLLADAALSLHSDGNYYRKPSGVLWTGYLHPSLQTPFMYFNKA